MVRVISVHHFDSQVIQTCEEPLAATSVPPDSAGEEEAKKRRSRTQGSGEAVQQRSSAGARSETKNGRTMGARGCRRVGQKGRDEGVLAKERTYNVERANGRDGGKHGTSAQELGGKGKGNGGSD